jgi:pyruvate/2-oxoglutarate dehydrogenase complex dihydrolipoamide dehydrogenase (E3) component
MVIGGGSAGLSAVDFAIKLGIKTVLIEKEKLGGDCTWFGCVPSKTLIKSAKVAYEMRNADKFGFTPSEPIIDLGKVLNHVENVIQEVYASETPEVLTKKGIDVIIGNPSFISPKKIQINNQVIEASKLLICTGARPLIPEIKGLKDIAYHTYETIFRLKKLPKTILIIGGGPIGCELAQAFSRLGSKVTMIVRSPRLLKKEEIETSELLKDVFQKENIQIHLNANIQRVWEYKSGIHVQNRDEELIGDLLLVATGRRPQLESLNLDKAKVKYDKNGIAVNKHLQTSQGHIYAAGDCIANNPQFTHYAGWQAYIATRNALLAGSSKGKKTYVPTTTFTDPEIAHIGMIEEHAKKQGMDIMTYVFQSKNIDRVRTDRDRGFIKLVMTSNEELLGVTVVGNRAGEMIHEWIAVLEGKMTLKDIMELIHVYPTYSFGNQQVAVDCLLDHILSSSKVKIAKFLGKF